MLQALSKEELIQENLRLTKENIELKAQIKKLIERIDELERRLNRNSQNSNNPPSTDQYAKPSRPQSLREKSGKKNGGQPGHKGSTLQQAENPDRTERHCVDVCTHCHHDLSNVQESVHTIRQEVDIEPVKPVATEHHMTCRVCPKCKHKNRAAGPKHLTQPIQFGTDIKAYAAYLHYHEFIPLKRLVEMFNDVFHIAITEATLLNMFDELCERLEPETQAIIAKIKESPSAYFDETGMYVNGELNWLHSASTEQFTAYLMHEKRGSDAMDAAGILSAYKGCATHDCWSPYFKFTDVEHSLCNAHHLRELRGLHETYKQEWLQQMDKLLLKINHTVKACMQEPGKTSLPEDLCKQFSADYDKILAGAPSQIPIIENANPKTRGRVKQHPTKNLLDRLTKYKPETLRFMYNFDVSFTNNQAERDVRMAKIKQKISGCFRTKKGAKMFCTIRGFISTLRKHHMNILKTIADIFKGARPFSSA